MTVNDTQQYAGQHDVWPARADEIFNLIEALNKFTLPAVLNDSTPVADKKLPSPQIIWTTMGLVDFAMYRSPDDLKDDIWDGGELEEYPEDDWADSWHVPFSSQNIYEEVVNSSQSKAVFQRLSELFPDYGAIRLAFNYLCECGVLTVSATPAFKLMPDFKHLVELFERFSGMWCGADDEVRITLAQGINDFEYLNRVAPTAEAASQAEECQKDWKAYVHQSASQGLCNDTTLALGHLGELSPYLDEAFSNERTATTALKFAGDDPQWCGPVWNLFQRSKSGVSLAEYLVCHRYKAAEVLTQLGARKNCSEKAIRMALKSFPHLIPDLLHDGVRLGTFTDQLAAVAVLALLDRPWCHDALAAVLSESDDRWKTGAVRTVLRNNPDPRLQQLAGEWEATNEPDGSFRMLEDQMMAARIVYLSRMVDAVRDEIPNPTA